MTPPCWLPLPPTPQSHRQLAGEGTAAEADERALPAENSSRADSTWLPQPKPSPGPPHPTPPGSRQAGRVRVHVGAGEALGPRRPAPGAGVEPGHLRRPPGEGGRHPLPSSSSSSPGGSGKGRVFRACQPPAAPAQELKVAPTAHAHTGGPGLASVH